MKKKIGLRTGFICLFLLLTIELYAAVYFTKEEALKMAFPEADPIEKRTVIILDEQGEKIKSLVKIKKISRIFVYYQGIKEDETIGYAVIKNVRGKHGYITFMAVIDLEGRIKMVTVLASREIRGAKIRQKRFLEQFKGKTINNPLMINSDIDAITGATISSRALTEGVKEALAYLCVVLELEISKKN